LRRHSTGWEHPHRGIFNTVNGQPRTNIARIHSDGGLDAFNPAAATSDTIFYYVAVDSCESSKMEGFWSGAILIGLRTNLARTSLA